MYFFKFKLHGTGQYFADHGAYLYSSDNANDLIHQMKEDLQKINEWIEQRQHAALDQ